MDKKEKYEYKKWLSEWEPVDTVCKNIGNYYGNKTK
jgi:hypothetical protein